ncbi:MAG: hypothetical protein OCU20_05875 [Methanophagales archaeon]|nr:hypothetical protein [Methanophagales archaeon]RLG35114.1 MAG: metal-dependent protease of the PAD1/JAB1 superfamily [Methanosarcinales archaeon]MCW3138886.1 hypothetical protein [Methanophagales archaeon]MCW3139364.1 hypothetical protein [Methanophagales archaeon]MCW7069127.1 hypothetical protein [Methanophagales archaeon]
MSKRRRIEGIAGTTLDFILEVSKSYHPYEFIGMLSADGDVISDVLLLPGMLSSDRNASIRLDMMPLGISYIGSVHNHPYPGPGAERPSAQDLFIFARTGNCHIITFYPYDGDCWRCYNSKGEERGLKIMEIEDRG